MVLFKYIFLLTTLLHTLVYAYEYNVYTLYNGEYEAVFPDKPSLIYKFGINTYKSADHEKQIGFTSNKFPSPLGHISKYSKKALDQVIIDSIKQIGTVIHFESNMDKQRGLYILIIAYSQYDNDLKMTLYTFEKKIITNNIIYSWRLTSATLANKKTFEQYKDFCKIR